MCRKSWGLLQAWPLTAHRVLISARHSMPHECHLPRDPESPGRRHCKPYCHRSAVPLLASGRACDPHRLPLHLCRSSFKREFQFPWKPNISVLPYGYAFLQVANPLPLRPPPPHEGTLLLCFLFVLKKTLRQGTLIFRQFYICRKVGWKVEFHLSAWPIPSLPVHMLYLGVYTCYH